jgi:tRNA/rRNA methyltransferase
VSQLSPQARRRLKNVRLVLVRPRFPENIGAAARVAANMALGGLDLVAPENTDPGPMQSLATRLGRDVLESMTVYPDLAAAVSAAQFVVGTTARLSTSGHRRVATDTPRGLARRLAPELDSNRAAIVFGPEDRGLENPEVNRCQSLVHIPTGPAGSLNLAQAVMVLAYEVFQAVVEPEGTGPTRPALAERGQAEAFLADWQRILIQIGAIDPQNPDYFFLGVRRIFDRAGLRPHEVRLWRGIVRRLDRALTRREGRD